MGYASPRRMLAEMTAAEYRGWKARQNIRGPMLPERLDFAAALVCYWVMESQRAKGEPMPFEAFMVEWDARARKAKRQQATTGRQTPAQMVATLQAFQAKLESRDQRQQWTEPRK